MNPIDDKGNKTNSIIAILFVLIYGITFPKAFLISDEWGYVGRALAMLNGAKSLIFNDLTGSGYQQDTLKDLSYPLGTSYLLAFIIFIFGKKMCFLIGLFSLLLSQLLMSKMVLKINGNSVVTLITWCCLPCLVISRTAMSDTPALLISALFFYIYFTQLKNKKTYFLMGLIGGLSILFRENLIVLFAFFLLKLFYDGNLFYRFSLLISFLLGILIRFLSAYYFYNDAFYYKLTTPFNTYLFFYNFFFYSCSLILIFPFAAFFILHFKNNKDALVLKLTVLAYLLFFSFYTYNGLMSGFLRSIILTNRFFMPLIPLFMVAYSQCFKRIAIDNQKKIHKTLFVFSFLMVISSQMVTHYFEEKNSGIMQCAENSPTLIISSKVTSAKYINLMTSNSTLIPYEACENNPKIISDVIKKQGYCDLFELSKPKGSNFILNFKKLFINQEICSFTTPDGFIGRVIRLK